MASGEWGGGDVRRRLVLREVLWLVVGRVRQGRRASLASGESPCRRLVVVVVGGGESEG